MRRQFKRITILRAAIMAAAALAVLSASGCTMAILHNLLGGPQVQENPDPLDPGSGLTQYLCESETVTLAWDPPAGEIAGYRVYVRVHESGDWSLIAELSVDDDPEVELHHADFGNGDFDFGVIAVDPESEESAMHTSLDPTAQPTTGWYLSWAL